VRLASEQGGALNRLIIGERDGGGDVGQFLDALVEQREAFRATAIEREDAGLGQERPTVVVQRAGIGAVTMWTDLDFGMRLRTDDPLHGVDLVLDIAAQVGDWLGDVFEGEKLLRFNRALPDKFVVDVGEETFAEFDARASEHERLERDVGQMDIFLESGSGFHFDQFPRIAGHRHENVGAGVAAVIGKGRFIKWHPSADCRLGLGNYFLRIDDAGCDLHAAWEKLLRQFADFCTLIENRLLGFIWGGNLVFGIVTEPEQLRALPPHQVGGFGQGWLAGGWHWLIHVELTDFYLLGKGRSQFDRGAEMG